MSTNTYFLQERSILIIKINDLKHKKEIIYKLSN